MRSLLALLVLAAAARAEDYVVLTGVGPDDPFHAAAEALVRRHGARLVPFDPRAPEKALPVLREIGPARVAVVIRPQQYDEEFVKAFHAAATKVDPDPFVDFDYGLITTADSREEGESELRVGRLVRGPFKVEPHAEDAHYRVGRLEFPSRDLKVTGWSAGHVGTSTFLKKEVPTLSGCRALYVNLRVFGSAAPRSTGLPSLLAKLDPPPAVAYCALSGSATLDPGGPVAALQRAGVACCVALRGEKPGGAVFEAEMQRVLTGSTVGAARRVEYAKAVLEEKQPDGVLFGDPALRAFPVREDALPARTEVTRSGSSLRVRATVAREDMAVWCLGGKVYRRVEVPEEIGSVEKVSLVNGEDPAWAVETDRGKRYVHLLADVGHPWRGVDVTFLLQTKVDLSDREQCRAQARAIGDKVLEELSAVEDGDFYDGAAGVGLFLMELFTATKDPRYREAADLMLAKAAAETTKPGLYSGKAGAAQVHLDAYRITGETRYLETAKRLAGEIGEPTGTDVIFGAAGMGIFFLNLHAATKDAADLGRARALGDWLLERAVREKGTAHWRTSAAVSRVYLGFSHGAAGVGYFLLHLARVTGDAKYRKAAEEAAAFVLEHAHDDGHGGLEWTKLQPPQKKDYYPVQWCHGSPGMGLFFLALKRSTGKAAYAKALERCIDADRRKGRTARRSGCQCHGVSGNAELFLEVWRAKGKGKKLVETARTFGGDLIGSQERPYRPGYMTGLSGIGRFFLRLSDPAAYALPLMVRD